uniref:FHA domain-containing protein n=4 Tax=Photinus pyralis TaxID=7054 RepID=A0A1Y1LQK1_PHOPY
MQAEAGGWLLQHIHRSDLCIIIRREETRIGRNRQCDFPSRNINVSRDHAVFITSNGRLYVKDNRSANGTYVNCIRIQPFFNREIFHNDEVGLGLHSQLEVELPELSSNGGSLHSENLIFIVKHVPPSGDMESTSSLVNDIQQRINEMENSSSSKPKSPSAHQNAEELMRILGGSQYDNGELPMNCEQNANGETPHTLQKPIVESALPDSASNCGNITSNGVFNTRTLGSTHCLPTSSTSPTLNSPNSTLRNAGDLRCDVVSSTSNKDENGQHQNEECGIVKMETTENEPIEDDYIIISDDETYSQLMDGVCPNTISENKETGEDFNDNVFSAIKKELEAYDAYDVPYGTVVSTVCINDEDSQMNFDSWLEDDNENREEPSNENAEKAIGEDRQGPTAENREEPVVAEEATNMAQEDPNKHTSTKSTTRDTNKSQSAKRKENEKEHAVVKKIKTSTFYKTPQERRPKVDRKDQRRQRLKEIALKTADNKEKENIPKVRAAKKVKVSEGRGNFLIEPDVPSTSKGPSVQSEVQTSSDDRKFVIPKVQKRTVPIIPPHIEKNRLKKVNPVAEAPASKPLVEVPHCLRPLNNCHKNREGSIILGRNSDIEYAVKEMLRWNPYWFVEFKKQNSVPKQVCQCDLQRMPKWFSSYQQYCNVVTPPMLMELWAFLSREYELANEQKKSHKFSALLTDVKISSDLTALHYTTYIDRKQYDSPYVKEDDILIISYEREVKNKRGNHFALGLVTRSTKTALHPNTCINKSFADSIHIVPFASINIHITITSVKGTILRGVNALRNVASVVPALRLFKSVQGMKHSALLSHILHPTEKLYSIGPLPQQTLYCKGDLNMSQQAAVLEASYICQRNSPGVYLIQGPPGTGKTTVILNILQQILFDPNYTPQKCILILAPSNAAVDELVARISILKDSMRRDLKLIRYGPYHMINCKVQKHSVFELAKRNTQSDLWHSVPEADKEILHSLKKHAARLQDLAIKKSSDAAIKEKYSNAKMEHNKKWQRVMGQGYTNLLRKYERQLLGGAEVVCTTLSSSIRISGEDVFRGKDDVFSFCIVDEATQGNEQETLMPLKLGVSKLILVGDPKQLPAVTQTRDVKNCGYGESLFSRIMANFPSDRNPVRLLNVQYRMNPEISAFPNKHFYGGRLQDSESVSKRTNIFKNLRPYIVFNLDMDSIVNSQEYVSKPETYCIIKLLNVITKYYKHDYSIGIVTPYNNQKAVINMHLEKIDYRPCITVSTVDNFQGQEKDIIIMSCVRENTNNFLSDEQRLNVAMTRAKYALIIIGSSSLFATCAMFGSIKEDACRRKLFVDVFPNTSESQLLKHLLIAK